MPLTFELTGSDSEEKWTLSPGRTLIAGRNRDADIILVDPNCSRRQFELAVHDDHVVLKALSQSVQTICNGVSVEAVTRLNDGAEIKAGSTRLILGIRQSDGESPRDLESSMSVAGEPAQASEHESVARGSSSDRFHFEKKQSQHSEADLPRQMTQSLQISGSGGDSGTVADFDSTVGPDMPLVESLHAVKVTGEAVIGRDEDCQLKLPHIQVSRRHAALKNLNGVTILRDLQSANGTFVDGRRIRMPVRLQPGARIGIGPYLLSWTGESLVPTTRTGNLQLEGRELTRRVPNRNGDGLETILDAVSVVVRPHEFVCLLGPTGSGKSTLLAALSARTPANSGQVLINQSDLYEEFESLKRDIAVVPQHDILHDELTLDEALTCTARLRLPEDTNRQEIENEIARQADQVGLTRFREKKLGEMSGGQRRRASLANELLGNPSLLFLDEVTSGLDEVTDRQMMLLFRRIADDGKTVACVTHTLANIEEVCHLVVLLTVGGKLAFIGTPKEACEYFQINRLGLVYEVLADTSQSNELQNRFKASSYYNRYVKGRLSPGEIPKDRDNELHEHRFFNDQFVMMRHQLPLLLGRYFSVFTADRRSLYGLVLQVVIVATVLFLVFGNVAPAAQASVVDLFRNAAVCCNVLFVLAVSCFWFGCNNSAREIVKERPIYTRELLVNLSPGSYYASKVILQFVVAAAQSLLLLALVDFLCDLPGDLLKQGMILAAASGAGVVVGLCLSALATTQEVALTLVPLVLIPQIILSDVFVKLEGLSRWLGSAFVANYWIYGLLRGTLPDHLIDQLNAPLVPPLRFVPAVVSLLIQTLTLILLSICVLHIRDRVMASSNKTLDQAISELPLIGRYFAKAFIKFRQRFGRKQKQEC